MAPARLATACALVLAGCGGGAATTRTTGGTEGYDLVGVEAMVDEARTRSHEDAFRLFETEIGPATATPDGKQTWWTMDEELCAVLEMGPVTLDRPRNAVVETTYLHAHDDGYADCQAKAAAPTPRP